MFLWVKEGEKGGQAEKLNMIKFNFRNISTGNEFSEESACIYTKLQKRWEQPKCPAISKWIYHV